MEPNLKLIQLEGGDRLEWDEQTNDGVMTDAGLIPWSWVAGFWCWYAAGQRYLFVPID